MLKTKRRKQKMGNNSKKLNTTFLIDEELLKTYSVMSRNVGVDKIIPYITLAQEFYLEPILGLPLMTELQTQISTDTLTDLNKGLIIKIAPCLSAWTDFLAARSLAYTVTAKGVTKEKSENSESLNNEEMAYYIHNLRETANQAQEMLIKYLCRCQENYPLFRPSSECDCSKYIKDDYGTADPDWRKLIYCPTGRPSGCPKCGE